RLFKRTSRINTPDMPDDKLHVDALVIYKNDRRVFWHGNEVEITTKEFDILLLLAEHVNRAFSREQLLVDVWGDDYFGSDRAVDDLIKRLRKKMDGIHIDTVWGYGYRFRDDEASS